MLHERFHHPGVVNIPTDRAGSARKQTSRLFYSAYFTLHGLIACLHAGLRGWTEVEDRDCTFPISSTCSVLIKSCEL